MLVYKRKAIDTEMTEEFQLPVGLKTFIETDNKLYEDNLKKNGDQKSFNDKLFKEL